MFDTTLDRAAPPNAPPGTRWPETLDPREPISLPGRSIAPVVWHWLAATLDELDYGIVLLDDGMQVVHRNEAARAELDQRHPLQLLGGELRARMACDSAPLREAIADAAYRGLRRLLTMGDEGERASISVIPLGAADVCPRAVLVVLGKRSVCESLSALGFARGHRLTSAETRVLVALCKGVAPALIAEQSGVALSTVRTQIGSIRAKTGAESIRALARQVAVLPPVKGVLRTGRKGDEGASLLSGQLSVIHPITYSKEDQ